MNAQKCYRNLTILLLTLSLLVPILGVSAQDLGLTNSLTLSEAQINTALRTGMQDTNNDLTIDLQPGQMVVNLTLTGQRGNTTRLALTIVPSIGPDGALQMDPTRLTLNDLEINLDNNPAVAGTTASVNSYLSQQTGDGQITGIIITDSLLTIEWTSTNPDDPFVAIRDNLFSLTFTESAINRMAWVTNPTGPYISALQVDLQPGQAVINMTRAIEPTSANYTIIPITVNGRVAWQVNANVEGDIAQTITTIWRAYFNGIYQDSSLIGTAITDQTISFTWDLTNLNNAQAGDPVVTYTASEAEVNAALATYRPADLSELAVDMQPGKVIILASGTNAAGAAYRATLTLLPVLAGGKLTWTPERLTLNDLVLDAAALQSGEQVTGALTRGLDGSLPGATITDLQITDSSMTLTVRYR